MDVALIQQRLEGLKDHIASEIAAETWSQVHQESSGFAGAYGSRRRSCHAYLWPSRSASAAGPPPRRHRLFTCWKALPSRRRSRK